MMRVISSFEGPVPSLSAPLAYSQDVELIACRCEPLRLSATTTVPLAMYAITLLKVKAEIELKRNSWPASDFAFMQPGRD